MVWLRAIQIQLIWFGLGLYKSSLYGLALGSLIQIQLIWYGLGLYANIQLIWLA